MEKSEKTPIGGKAVSCLFAATLAAGLTPAFTVPAFADGDPTEIENTTGANEQTSVIAVKTTDDASAIQEKASNLKAGDTLRFPAGEFEIGTLTISVAANIEGAGAESTTLSGNIMYDMSEQNQQVSVSSLTLSSQDANDHQGLCLKSGTGVTLSVSNCIFDGWEYAIGVNSQSTKCKLSVSNTSFENTFCAMSVKGGSAGNELAIGENVQTTEGCFAVQQFNPGESGYSLNGYYADTEGYQADVANEFASPSPTVDALAQSGFGTNVTSWEASYDKGGVPQYGSLESIIESLSEGAEIEITLNTDVELTENIQVPKNVTISIEGNDHTISYNALQTASKAAFNNTSISTEGIPADTTLRVNNVNFVNTGENNSTGFVAIIGGNAFDSRVEFHGCSFDNFYTPVYMNACTEAPSDDESYPSITIDECAYKDTQYGYSIDNASAGAVVVPENEIVETYEPAEGAAPGNEHESWTTDVVRVTSSDTNVTKTYSTFANAIAAAQEGDTITLNADVTGPITINKAITLVGNGNTVTAASGNAITVTVGGVTLEDVHAVATTGTALSVTDGTTDDGNIPGQVEGGITVVGGTYENAEGAMQGSGAMRLSATGDVSVTGATTIGGIHVLNADGKVAITGNTVGFTYDGETPYVGILVLEEPKTDSDAATVVKNNTISVPNKSSFYAQYGADWEFAANEQVAAESSVAKVGDAYYLTLQDAVDAVADKGAIEIIAACDEDVEVSREITFTIKTATGSSFTGSVKAADGYVLSEKDGTYTVSKETPAPVVPSEPTYATEVAPAENGSVAVTPSKAEAGDKVVITAKPDEGYKVDTVEVADSDGKAVAVAKGTDGTWSFEMPEGGATVEVTFTWDNRFADVAEGDWFYPAVEYVVTNGIMVGYQPDYTLFGSYDALTRAQMVQLLYNLAGAPEATYEGSFPDVAADSIYADAIAWAVDEGIANGYGNTGLFEPDKSVSREETAAFLCRYAASTGADVSANTAVLAGYPDATLVSEWAVDEMAWAVETGAIYGVGGAVLAPASDSARAEVAQMMMNYLTAE